MFCSDPFLTYLKDFGYSVVRLPRKNLAPLQLMVNSGKDLESLGSLEKVFVSEPDGATPTITRNEAAANISGQQTRDLSLGVGLSILGNVLGAMGGSNLGIDVAYKNARSVAFEFSDVLRDSIDIADLDQFLGSSDINPKSVHIATLLDSDEIYVVTSTLKSKRFSVLAKTKSKSSTDISVPDVQNIVGGKVKVKSGGNGTGKVTYEGNEELVFGFQAVRLLAPIEN